MSDSTKPAGKRLLVKVRESDWGAADLTHILVTLDAEYIERLKQYYALVRPAVDDPMFYEASFFDYGPRPVDSMDVDDSAWYSELDVLEVPADAEIPSPGFRMDSCTVSIQKEGVLWRFYGKHDDRDYETETVPWITLGLPSHILRSKP